MNTFDNSYKSTNFIHSVFIQKLKFIVQIPNQNENPMKTGIWAKKFLMNSFMEKKVYKTIYYDKADKITEIKNILLFNSNLDLSLFKYRMFNDINIFLAEPTIVAAEHGYDIFTRNVFLPIRLRILNDADILNITFLTIFKLLFDVNIYFPKN